MGFTASSTDDDDLPTWVIGLIAAGTFVAVVVLIVVGYKNRAYLADLLFLPVRERSVVSTETQPLLTVRSHVNAGAEGRVTSKSKV